MLQRQVSRREFVKLMAQWTIGASLTGMGGYEYVKRIEPGWIDASSVSLALPRMPRAFDGYRLAQFSDVHMGGWMDRQKLADVVRTVNSLKPDLIAITGDFVTRHPEQSAEDLVAGLKPLSAPDGVVAVLGNHDYSSDSSIIRQVLEESGIIDVNNGVHTLRRGRALFHVAGVDDVWHKRARLEQVLEELPAEGGAMLLAHEPDFADVSAATGRFDLQISGHSHGGQVILPFVGPLRLPHLGRKYPLGLYRVEQMLQYTNRGVGMVNPYVRFNCRPEITLFTLRAA
jgi:uncharacterized protein